MNKLTTTTLSACLLLCAGGAFAQDAMKKDDMAADHMAKPMSMQDCKDHMAMAAKDSSMKKDDASMKMDAQCSDMMKKDGMMKKDAMQPDAMAKDPMKK